MNLNSLQRKGYFEAERSIINRVFDAAILDTWPVEDWSRGAHFFQLNAYSLRKYFLASIFHNYKIQDGDPIRKCALVRPKYECTAGQSRVWEELAQ